MHKDERTLLEYLALYGADIKYWPPQAREFGLRAHLNPTFTQQIEEYRQMEELLRLAHIAPNADNLADRIIAQSLLRKQKHGFSFVAWLGELYSIFSAPQLALTITALLFIGFTIGQSDLFPASPLNAQEETSISHIYLDDSGSLYAPTP